MTRSDNIIDFALAARKLRQRRVADLLSHLEKAQPEGFQDLGDGRERHQGLKLATSPSAGLRRPVSYKPQTSIVGGCRKSFPKLVASSERTIGAILQEARRLSPAGLFAVFLAADFFAFLGFRIRLTLPGAQIQPSSFSPATHCRRSAGRSGRSYPTYVPTARTRHGYPRSAPEPRPDMPGCRPCCPSSAAIVHVRRLERRISAD